MRVGFSVHANKYTHREKTDGANDDGSCFFLSPSPTDRGAPTTTLLPLVGDGVALNEKLTFSVSGNDLGIHQLSF